MEPSGYGRDHMTAAMHPVDVRLARADEHGAVAECVNAAYVKHVPRIGKKPAPMLASYPGLIASGSVYVVDGLPGVQAVLVIELHDDHLFIENVAVHPDHQGTGLGRRMMDFAEQQAHAAGIGEIRLYTHELMTENLTYYARLGYEEVDRRSEDGYSRVFMRKRLA